MATAPRSRPALLAESGIELIIRLAGWSAAIFVFAILFFVCREAVPVLFEGVSRREFLGSAQWRPESVIRPQFGILALLAGTLAVTGLSMMIAMPFGLAAAIFIAEFCSPRLREALKVLVELLAAIPSVVWGFVAYMVTNPLIVHLTGAAIGLNVLNGAIILALMSVPIIVSMGEDALRAVPATYREAALALGASRWQVVYRVLIPGAKNGLLAAALLGVGRAIGETMAVLMATGHSVRIPHGILDPVRTLTATIAAELGEAVAGGTHYRVLFLIGTLLMVISLAVNFTAALIVRGPNGR